MPELAEVETVRRDVEACYSGRLVTGVEVTGARSVRRHPDPSDFTSRVAGRRLIGTGRRGKFLLLHLSGGDVLVAHLGMSGQLRSAPPASVVAPHTHVRLSFDDGPELRFVDPRTFGQMWVSTPRDGVVPELAHLGFDPVEDPRARARWAEILRRPTRLKALLMDQSRVAGIGNMYADEILWRARLRPDRPAATVSAAEAARLVRSAGSVLRAAIELRGSSLSDAQYRDLHGRIGGYQHQHRVYAREGQPCRRCRTPIERLRFQGRSAYFCPGCQA